MIVASLGEGLPRACLLPALPTPALVKADCIRVRLSPAVHPKWVLYALRRPEAKRWAEEQLHGVGRMRLGLNGIRSVPIPLPPLDEQHRIVAVLEDHLSRLDAARDYTAAASRRATRWQRASIDEIVNQPGLRSCRLGDLVHRIEAGRSFGGSAPPAHDAEWGVIRVSAMTWGAFRPQENKAVPESQVDPRHEIHLGDVLVSRANTTEYVGAPVLVEDTRPRLLLSDKSLRLVPEAEVDARWLVEVLGTRSVRRQVSALARGTKDSMRNISQANLLSVKVPAAAHRDQEDAVEVAVAVRQQASRLESQAAAATQRTASLRRQLMSAAFAGEL